MEQIYKRVEDIDEKVKDARLPYQEWKVLFLLGEQSDVAEVSSLISDDSSSVSDIFESLESKGLVEKVTDDEEQDEAAATIVESPAPALGDELLMEEDEKPEEPILGSEFEDTTVESDVSQPEEIESVEEVSESIDEDKIEVNTDFLTEDLLPKDEQPIPGNKETESLQEEPFPTLEPDSSETEFDLNLDEEIIDVAEEPAPVESKEPESQAEIETEPAPEEETISDVSKKTIMVIDDSIVIRKMIEIALEDEDFNIVTAISGKEGLENIEALKPNLVILDMMLPDMNGIDVLKTIKSEKNLPVIMLSGKDSPQLIENAKEIGVDDFLPKPFRDEELVEKVRTLVGA